MPTFHHVNLGVPPDGSDAEGEFLVGVLGYRKVPPEERPQGLGVRWYRADDGSEVHLSEDAEHRPAEKAHVAVVFGDALPAVEQRLGTAGIEHKSFQLDGFPRVVTCRDPAGNLWELRG
ncbi:MAG: glyoxalase [Actinomycetota bacterium]|nr:glyoxalase [Actinomycetota bacterium]